MEPDHQRNTNTRQNQDTHCFGSKQVKLSQIHPTIISSNDIKGLKTPNNKEVQKSQGPQTQSRELNEQLGHHVQVTSLTSYSRSNRALRLFNVQEVLFELSIMVLVIGCFALVVLGKTLLKTNDGDVYL